MKNVIEANDAKKIIETAWESLCKFPQNSFGWEMARRIADDYFMGTRAIGLSLWASKNLDNPRMLERASWQTFLGSPMVDYPEYKMDTKGVYTLIEV